MAEKYEYGRMKFADALLKEIYAAQLQLQLDVSRQLFWDPNPAYGPQAPAWVTAGKMFDDAYTWDPPSDYYEGWCEYCGNEGCS